MAERGEITPTPIQKTLWVPGFVNQFFLTQRKWVKLTAYEALTPENIKSALEETKESPVSDVIAALIFEIDRYQITLRAQEDTINRLMLENNL